MRPMPEQNSLPFPDAPKPPTPAQKPATTDAPAPDAAAPPAADHDNAAPTAGVPMAPPLPTRQAKRPLWARLLGRVADPWLALNIEPEAPVGLLDGRPVCYVLEDYGLSNALILDRACRDAGLPSPLVPLPVGGNPLGRKRAYVALSRRNASTLIPDQVSAKTHSGSLARLLQAHRGNPALDVQLVPVSIFVGRAPDKQSGWFSVLFSENWALVGRFRRLLSILLNGRDTLVQFAAPVSIRDLLAEDLPPERAVRKLSRVLRTHFRRLREVVIGPDLSTRRMLADRTTGLE